MNNAYKTAFGTWSVSTEGDEEGRTERQLGTFTGYIDEIALALADKAFYELKFKSAIPLDNTKPTKSNVNVQLDIESGTWDMDADDRREFASRLLAGRPVTVTESNYYGCFMIRAKNEADVQKQILREQALNKLSAGEKAALGIK
jgi:hypothetical protein